MAIRRKGDPMIATHASGQVDPRVTTEASILVVDDDATKRFALRAILEPLGVVLVEAASGADALRQLLRQDFGAVLLDVRMPIMDGFETARLIRQRPRSELTPIIFVTAFDAAETDMGKGYDLGAVDFVFAPVVPAILRAKVGVFVELYRAQLELQRYRDQLEELVEERTAALTAVNRELEAFNYSVSHDLRAPLEVLDGLSRSLVDTYGRSLDSTASDYLHRMRQATERMTSVFDALQTLFRLTSSEIRRESIHLSAMAADIIEELRARSPQRTINVTVADGLRVSGDARLLRIVMTNLLDNAWKFTVKVDDGAIQVGSEVVDGERRIFVRDNGAGFDMIYAHKLFGAFQRLHSQSEFPGAGMGLAMVRRIVNRHGGRCWAEGAVGEGATFYFVL